MSKHAFKTGLLVLCGLNAALLPARGFADAIAPGSISECPFIKPMHGLLPILFWIGLLPKPAMASTVAASDTGTSVVIRPNPKDQIACGRTRLEAINDVVFVRRTLSNGRVLDLSMDIQIPDSPKRRPLVIYVTGGGFIQAPKEAALNLRTYVAEAGFVVASIEYRTARNGANYRDGIADVKSAIRYLRANAAKYRIDPEHVAVWGESAGGYLVAMAGVTNGNRSFDAGNDLDKSSEVQAVVDKFGSSDNSKVASDFDPGTQAADNLPDNSIARYIGIVPGTRLLDAKIAATVANPLAYINAAVPPFLIFHGSRDRLVSPSQTLMLHNALNAGGGHSVRYVLDGADHGDLSFLGDVESGLPWSARQTMDIIVDFLKASLGGV